MTIIEALKAGKIEGSSGARPAHISMMISDVFVFDAKVYKAYKSGNAFFNENFNDLSDKKNRFQFTRHDFEWNSRLSPEIYLSVRGAALKNGRVEFLPPTDDAEELVIEMNKVDMKDQLLRRLVEGRISLADCREIGKQFGEKERRLPKIRPQNTAYGDLLSRYGDICRWVAGVERYIPKSEVQGYMDYLKDFIESHRREFDSKDGMSACIDIHADNAIYADGAFLPMDIYAARETWIEGYKFTNIYRLATDFYAFLGKEHFEEVLKGYEESTGKAIPREYAKFFVTYSGLLSWPYHYILHKKELWRLDVAKKVKSLLAGIFKEGSAPRTSPSPFRISP